MLPKIYTIFTYMQLNITNNLYYITTTLYNVLLVKFENPPSHRKNGKKKRMAQSPSRIITQILILVEIEI